MLKHLVNRMESALFAQPARSRYARWLLTPLRYPYALAWTIARGELTLRAMSLVYTTLLSLVPLLALVFSILKALGYHRNLQPLLLQFLEPMGEQGSQLAEQIMSLVNNARGDVLGSLGIAMFLYTAVSMIQKVEESFNHVWRVQEPRSIGRRIGEYLGVLTVGPVLIVTALGLMATLANNQLVRGIAQAPPFGALIHWFGKAAPYILVAASFTFMYAFVPNTKVKLRAAAVGGVVAGIVWVGSGVLFGSFVTGANTTMIIYAGFAVVILALIWLYISWLILLVGAQLSYFVQHPQALRPGSTVDSLNASDSERLALAIMYLLAQGFAQAPGRDARRFTLNTLAQALDVAATTLSTITGCLERAGLVVVTEDDFLLPGRDLDAVRLVDVLDAVRNDGAGRAASTMRGLPAPDAVAAAAEGALRASLGERTLKQLITE